MTVGFPVNKIDIDSALGQVSVQLRDSISRVPVLVGVVNNLTDEQLEGLGYTQTDIPLLRASLTDLVQLYEIAFGLTTQADKYDFRQNISKVTGLA